MICTSCFTESPTGSNYQEHKGHAYCNICWILKHKEGVIKISKLKHNLKNAERELYSLATEAKERQA